MKCLPDGVITPTKDAHLYTGHSCSMIYPTTGVLSDPGVNLTALTETHNNKTNTHKTHHLTSITDHKV